MGFRKAFSGLTVVSVAAYSLLYFMEPRSIVSSDAAQAKIPSFGLGTWLADKGEVAHAVEYALKAGYRHIDAAAIYRNEDEVGQGIAASGVPRDEIWVTSKLWNTDHRPELVRKAAEKSLAALGVGYLDLYLMHWPVALIPGTTEPDKNTSLEDTWLAMEELVRANLTRHIGVSNFSPSDMQRILKVATIRPYAHEFETHPYLQQQTFVDYHTEQGIKVIAYSPLANTNPTYNPGIPSILVDPFWVKLAASKNATVAQAVLAWGQQRGTVVIPKSTHEKYIDQNFGSRDVKFTEDELLEVSKQDKKFRLLNPGKNWGAHLFEGLDGVAKDAEKNEEL